MKQLEIINWSNLNHAYGTATDIPVLLRQLEQFPPHEGYKSEPYFSLWNALCHQGDIYSASYAAFPYIVDFLATKPLQGHWSALLLVASIEISRQKGDGPPIYGEFKTDYTRALKRLPMVVAEMASQDWDEFFARVASAAIVAAKGEAELAVAILELEPKLIPAFKEWVLEQ